MNYYESAFPVYASSDGIAYEIYLAGCKGYCNGCHSRHTWDFNAGIPMEEALPKLIADIDKRRDEIDNIVVLGGEPLDNKKDELQHFFLSLDKAFPEKKLYLYTHFKEKDVNTYFPFIYDLVDYIKVGGYDATKPNKKKDPLTNVTLVSWNQYFVKGNRGENND